jgi:hypothetical protein
MREGGRWYLCANFVLFLIKKLFLHLVCPARISFVFCQIWANLFFNWFLFAAWAPADILRRLIFFVPSYLFLHLLQQAEARRVHLDTGQFFLVLILSSRKIRFLFFVWVPATESSAPEIQISLLRVQLLRSRSRFSWPGFSVSAWSFSCLHVFLLIQVFVPAAGFAGPVCHCRSMPISVPPWSPVRAAISVRRSELARPFLPSQNLKLLPDTRCFPLLFFWFCSHLFLCPCTTFGVWFYHRQSVPPPLALHLRVFPASRLRSTDASSVCSCFS